VVNGSRKDLGMGKSSGHEAWTGKRGVSVPHGLIAYGLIMSNCEHRWGAVGRIMSSDSRTRDERNRNLRWDAGGGVCGGDGLPDAADEAADCGICIAEDVSGMRVDYAAGEGGLPGVREGDGERSGGAAGSGLSWALF
jgi:hypothetical protein